MHRHKQKTQHDNLNYMEMIKSLYKLFFTAKQCNTRQINAKHILTKINSNYTISLE